MFLFLVQNTRNGELWWRPINSTFSPSPMGKEKLVGIRGLGLFVPKDSKEMLLKNSYCLEYGFSLWRGHTNWNTRVIFKWITEIKDLKKIMWLALVGYVSRFKRTGWPWGTIPPWSIGFSLVKWIRSPSTLTHSPKKAHSFFYWGMEVGEKRKNIRRLRVKSLGMIPWKNI